MAASTAPARPRGAPAAAPSAASRLTRPRQSPAPRRRCPGPPPASHFRAVRVRRTAGHGLLPTKSSNRSGRGAPTVATAGHGLLPSFSSPRWTAPVPSIDPRRARRHPAPRSWAAPPWASGLTVPTPFTVGMGSFRHFPAAPVDAPAIAGHKAAPCPNGRHRIDLIIGRRPDSSSPGLRVRLFRHPGLHALKQEGTGSSSSIPIGDDLTDPNLATPPMSSRSRRSGGAHTSRASGRMRCCPTMGGADSRSTPPWRWPSRARSRNSASN